MSRDAGYKSFLLKFGYWAAILGVALLFIRYLLGPLTPFIIAIAIAALLQPLVRRLSKLLKMKKKVVAALLVVLTYLLLAGLLVLAVIGAISAIIDWASGLPELVTGTIAPWITNKAGELMLLLGRLDPGMNASVDSLLKDAVSALSGSIMNFSVNIVSWASSVGSRLPGAMLAMVICIIATVFCTGDYEKIKSTVVTLLPEKLRSAMEPAREAFQTIIGNYAKSYARILLLTFGELAVGLLIIGVDNALFVALIVAVFDILPIVGSGMVLLPWTIVKFIQGDIGVGIGLSILYVVVIIVRQIAEPRIVGKQVGLAPIVTLLCMWVGLKVFGGIGMFALPITLLLVKHLVEDGVIHSPFNKSETVEPQEAEAAGTAAD